MDRTRLASLAGTLLLATLTLGGCGAQRRPLPAQPAPPPPVQSSALELGRAGVGENDAPVPRHGTAYSDQSDGVSFIASAVPGAGAVDAVVLGNLALLGTPSTDAGVHKKLSDQIRSSFPAIAEVRVTSDPATIQRLRLVRQQIIHQRSVAPLLPELANLSRAMQPVQ